MLVAKDHDVIKAFASPVRADQMTWSNSAIRENIDRFDAARQPDRFYSRDRRRDDARQRHALTVDRFCGANVPALKRVL
jgi:hypothetical protein